MKKILHFFKYLFQFISAKIIAKRRYDGKYLTGRWFSSPYHGLGATGWNWIRSDAKLCRLLDVNQNVPWPCSPRIVVVQPKNIVFHPDDLNNFQTFGCYYQAMGKITIGHGTYIAPNVGLITANHNFYNLDEHLTPKPIVLGEKCWIGMNSVILGGVVLGNNTIVGAGSIVTKSFPEGHCVIVGNPAKKIKDLEQLIK